MPKVARNASNIGEDWNQVCCHGNKTVKLRLWSTFRARSFGNILEQECIAEYIPAILLLGAE